MNKKKHVLVIGLSGKRGSGKDSVARLLKILLNNSYEKNSEEDEESDEKGNEKQDKVFSKILHLSVPIKGMRLLDGLESRAYQPQLDDDIREQLINVGSIGRELDENLWIKTLAAHILYYCQQEEHTHHQYLVFIVPDIRFINEVEAIQYKLSRMLQLKKRGFNYKSAVFQLKRTTSDGSSFKNNVNEKIDTSNSEIEQDSSHFERLIDKKIFFTNDLKTEVIDKIKCILVEKGFPLEVCKRLSRPLEEARPKIYLSHPITDCQEANRINNFIEEKCLDYGLEPVSQFISLENNTEIVLKSLNEGGLKFYAKKISNENMRLLAESDGVLCYLYQKSIGCAEELIFADLYNKPTAVVVPFNFSLLLSPLLHFRRYKLFGSISSACDWLSKIFRYPFSE